VIESSDPHQIFQIGGRLIRRPSPDVALIKWFSAWGDFYKSCKFMSGVMRSGSDSSRVIPLLPWRLRNCATMTALCRIVLLTRFWRTRQT